jgi:hypothetical protein
LTDVSEVLTASIIREIMEATQMYEMSVNFFTRLNGATSQKTATFIVFTGPNILTPNHWNF